jgi:hypothetical protein
LLRSFNSTLKLARNDTQAGLTIVADSFSGQRVIIAIVDVLVLWFHI